MDDHLPLPTAAPFDEPMLCAKVNVQWWPYIVGAVNVWKASLAFTGDTPAEDFFQRQNIYALEKLLAEAGEENCATMPTIQHQTVRAVDHRSQGVNGGTTTANAWTALQVTGILGDNSGAGEIVTGGLYLDPSAFWKVTASHVFRCNVAGQARIRLMGDNAYASPLIPIPAGGTGVCTVHAMISTFVTEKLTWQYYVTQTQTNTGLGQLANVSGELEIYGEIFAERIVLVP